MAREREAEREREVMNTNTNINNINMNTSTNTNREKRERERERERVAAGSWLHLLGGRASSKWQASQGMADWSRVENLGRGRLSMKLGRGSCRVWDSQP